MLELDAVTVRYGSQLAVREVSATIASGEWIGLIGPNGAGKSSLLRSITRLERHGGTVRIDGGPTDRLPRRQLAQLIAYVPQQPEMPAGMSIIDYILLGRTPHIGYFGVESDRDRRYCIDVLDRLGMAAMAERALPTLSGGELQRVVLARALAQQAPLLLLDEPTSALDLGHRVEALELVDELRAERDLTVISSMHDLTLAAQFADRLLLLDGGVLVAAGAPADVLDEDQLSRCFGGRVRVLPDESGAPLVVPARTRRDARR